MVIKKNLDCMLIHGIPITYTLEMDFFLHKLEVIAVCHVYVTQSGLKRPFHETRDMSSEWEFCCSLHVSVSLRK